MRNLKKFLALVLALMMVVSVMVTVSATDYKDDGSINPDYAEAVEVMSAIGVLKGSNDGNFYPANNLFRDQAAKIVAYMKLSVIANTLEGADSGFSDVTADWSSGAIAYCADQGIVDGDGNGHFGPGANVTGYEFAKMLLNAVGKEGTYTGPSWKINVRVDAKTSGILNGLDDVKLDEALTREQAAQMAFNTLTIAKTAVTHYIVWKNDTKAEKLYEGDVYNTAMLYAQYKDAVVEAQDTLGQQVFGLADENDVIDAWGTPGKVWTAVNPAAEVVLPYEPVQVYDHSIEQCDLTEEVNGGERFWAAIVTNGYTYDTVNDRLDNSDRNVVTAEIKSTNTDKALFAAADQKNANTDGAIGAKGRYTAVYENPWFETVDTDGTPKSEGPKNPSYIIVEIDTLLAKVTKVTEVNKDLAGHMETPSRLTLAVYDADTNTTAAPNYTTTSVVVEKDDDTNWEYSVGDYVLIHAWQGNNDNYPNYKHAYDNEWQYVEVLQEAESVIGAQSRIIKNADQHEVEGDLYDDNNRFHLDQAGEDRTTEYEWFQDLSGNLIGAVNVAEEKNYGVVTEIWWADNANNGKGEARATITYVNGTESESYVVVNTVDVWDNTNTRYVTATPKYERPGTDNFLQLAGLETKDGKTTGTVGLSSESKDNYKDGDSKNFVNDELFEIKTGANGKVTLKAVSEVKATITAKTPAASGVTGQKNTSDATLAFNNASKYLVRTKTTDGYEFKPASGIPDKGYKDVFVDYTEDSNGFMTYGLIMDDSTAAAENNPANLVFVQGKQYETSTDKTKDIWVLKQVLIAGEQKDLKVGSKAIAEALTSRVGGLFYVTYTGDVVNGYCQINTNKAHGAQFFTTVNVREGVLTAADGSLINVNTDSKIVTEQGATQANAIANLEMLDQESIYVVFDTTNTSLAKLIYVLNDNVIGGNMDGYPVGATTDPKYNGGVGDAPAHTNVGGAIDCHKAEHTKTITVYLKTDGGDVALGSTTLDNRVTGEYTVKKLVNTAGEPIEVTGIEEVYQGKTNVTSWVSSGWVTFTKDSVTLKMDYKEGVTDDVKVYVSVATAILAANDEITLKENTTVVDVPAGTKVTVESGKKLTITGTVEKGAEITVANLADIELAEGAECEEAITVTTEWSSSGTKLQWKDVPENVIIRLDKTAADANTLNGGNGWSNVGEGTILVQYKNPEQGDITITVAGPSGTGVKTVNSAQAGSRGYKLDVTKDGQAQGFEENKLEAGYYTLTIENSKVETPIFEGGFTVG